MRKFVHVVVSTVLLVSSTGAQAAATAHGLVNVLFIHTPCIVRFQVGPAISSSSPCSSEPINEWAFAFTDPVVKSMMALSLSVQSNGKPLLVL